MANPLISTLLRPIYLVSNLLIPLWQTSLYIFQYKFIKQPISKIKCEIICFLFMYMYKYKSLNKNHSILLHCYIFMTYCYKRGWQLMSDCRGLKCINKNGICYKTDQLHAKRSLISWVVVISKEGRACMATPALLLVWHRLFGKEDFFYFHFLSQCHNKTRAGAVMRNAAQVWLVICQIGRVSVKKSLSFYQMIIENLVLYSSEYSEGHYTVRYYWKPRRKRLCFYSVGR